MDPKALEIRRIAPGGDLAAAFAIRREVFIGEQAIDPAIELDGRDAEAVHYLAVAAGEPVGTARVHPLAPGVLKVERVAVRAAARRHGIGAAIMTRIVDDARTGGVRRVELSAQLYVRDFYLGLGFDADGGVYEEAGIPHVHMHRDL